MALTSEQEKVYRDYVQFLLDDSVKTFYIFGRAGTGKSYLVKQLYEQAFKEYKTMCKILDVYPKYISQTLTATTHKAARVLSMATGKEATTIHSLLNLQVVKDFSTGKTSLTSINKGMPPVSNEIIFIDECSMLSEKVKKLIETRTPECKIVYLGDNNQLPPVEDNESWLFKVKKGVNKLTQPVRNKDTKNLQRLCNMCAEALDNNQSFKPFECKDFNCKQILDPTEAEELIKQFESSGKDYRVLAFTNEKVTVYTEFIKNLRKQTTPYKAGSCYINNSFINFKHKDKALGQVCLHTDELVKILSINNQEEFLKVKYANVCPCISASVVNSFGYTVSKVYLPKYPKDLQSLLNTLKAKKLWKDYYLVKETVCDLRLPDVLTIHKSQGSTYDTVIVDLESFNRLRDAELARRLFYVAVSRAKKEVIFLGKLPSILFK